jgi:hypothetical protein
MSLSVKWIDRNREPTEPADPNYPNGIDLNLTRRRKGCRTELPYPAKRCGYYSVLCESCGSSAVITTAGRRDDPKSVRIPCKPN